MSKKSRKRNKKILGLLGVLGAGLAMANRKPKQSSVSVESGRDSGLRDTVDSVKKKSEPIAEPIVIPKKKPVVVSAPIGKMRGAGNTDAEAIAAQKTRGDYAQNIRDAQADETSVGNYPTEPFIKPNIRGRFGNNRSFKSGGRAKLKSGGKVKGCGKALRGFGRAMKGKK